MSVDLPPDVWNEIQRQLATGSFRSPDEVMREALAALRDRKQEVGACERGIDSMEPPNAMPAEQAIREAFEDLKAGRHQPAAEVSREMRRKYNLPE